MNLPTPTVLIVGLMQSDLANQETVEKVKLSKYQCLPDTDNGAGWFDTNRKAVDWFLNDGGN